MASTWRMECYTLIRQPSDVHEQGPRLLHAKACTTIDDGAMVSTLDVAQGSFAEGGQTIIEQYVVRSRLGALYRCGRLICCRHIPREGQEILLNDPPSLSQSLRYCFDGRNSIEAWHPLHLPQSRSILMMATPLKLPSHAWFSV